MKLSEKQAIFSKNISYLIQYANKIGIDLTFGEAHRTQSQILLNFFGYKVVKGGVLGIKLRKSKKLSNTLHSLHASRLAVDFNFFIDGNLTYEKEDIQRLGDYWEGLHPDNRWGGNWTTFVDTPHFEMKP